jgi:outer membrane receptor protein involved in Fe transport
MIFRKALSVATVPTVMVVGMVVASNALAATGSDADSASADAGAPAGTDSGPTALQQITVLGQRTTPEIARAAQQQALNLINLTTADEMQRLPDVNTGEAIRRVPGISLETDTGEGRYINIRGLDADLNSTTFGGLRAALLPVPPRAARLWHRSGLRSG